MHSNPSMLEIHAPFLEDVVWGSSGIRNVPCEHTRRSARLSRLLLHESTPERKHTFSTSGRADVSTIFLSLPAVLPRRGHAEGYLSSLRHGAAAVRSAAAVHHPVPRLKQAQTQRATQVSGPEDAHHLRLRGARCAHGMHSKAHWLHLSLDSHDYWLLVFQEFTAIYITVEYDPKEASPSTNVCSGGVFICVIRIPYHVFGSVRAYVWPNVLVSVSQHPIIWMLSLYLYIQLRDGWTQQDPEHCDPLHEEGSGFCGCNINLGLTFSFNISPLLRNKNCFKGNIQFGFHILVEKTRKKLCYAAFQGCLILVLVSLRSTQCHVGDSGPQIHYHFKTHCSNQTTGRRICANLMFMHPWLKHLQRCDMSRFNGAESKLNTHMSVFCVGVGSMVLL